MAKKKEKTTLTLRTMKARRTREDIIKSTISLIKEGGFAAASSGRIAKRTGMTWGAAQHHFGSKEDILNAILEMSYESYVATMTAPDLNSGTLANRVNLFVDRIWTHYKSDLYLVALEILMGTREEADHSKLVWESPRGKVHLTIAREIFPDSKLSDGKIQEALTFIHCCLTGLSIECIFVVRERNMAGHLERIKSALLLMLSAP